MPRKQTATVNFTLRMREGLRRQLEQIAARKKRSINEEIVHRLEQSLRREQEGELLEMAKDTLRQVQEFTRLGSSTQPAPQRPQPKSGGLVEPIPPLKGPKT